MSNDGKFIVLEGIDGSGTTTQAKLLADYLTARGHSVFLTAEPTTGPIGRLIREFLKGAHGTLEDGILNPELMTHLFTADRVQHVHDVIIPAMKRGVTVISDRYYYSTWAYQSIKIDSMWVHSVAKPWLFPHLTFILDPDVDKALARIEGRTEKEVYEKREFLIQVQKNYRQMFGKDPAVQFVDSTFSVEEVSEFICGRVTEQFGL